MKAIVTGMIATYPVGGVVWDYLQYALGLERLGFETYYLEDTGGDTYDPRRGLYSDDCSYGVAFLAEALAEFSPTLGRRWHFRSSTGRCYGLSAEDINEVASQADLLLNVSGGTLLRLPYLSCRCKVLIDTDPGWNHFVNYPRWEQQPEWQGAFGFRAHDHFFTYALGMGQSDCALPDFGIRWHATVPPVILDLWQPEPPGTTWTTVMTWDNFRRPIVGNGTTYGTKELEFGKVEALPSRTSATLELAVGGTGGPQEHWRSLGWKVVDSHAVSKDAGQYRAYIQRSRGEFSVAKNVYVATRSGWFSCRSVCYLAAGRPVVIQDTGFSRVIPAHAGLLAFTSLAEASEAIEAVELNYARHQEAARAIAHDYFAAEKVLGRLLEQVHSLPRT